MDIVEAYKRFKFYHELHGNIYVYPNYSKDLETILNFVGERIKSPEEMFDCAWGNPEGESE